MDSNGVLKFSGMDEADDDMDTDGEVAADVPSVADSEKESAVADIIDNIIDAAVSSSTLENCSGETGTGDASVNHSQQDDVSPVCDADKQDNTDVVETDVSACDDADNSKTFSRQAASAVAEKHGDTSTSSSPSTSSTSSPDTDESDQFGGYTVNQVDTDSDNAEHHRESTADTQGAGQ